MKITAAVVESPDAPFQLEEVEISEPRPDELLVKIVAVGMCHTDLSVRAQATPFPLPGVLGHEGAGVVIQVGAQVSDFDVGDKVVLSFDSCGSCPACQAGKVVYCRHWIPLNLLGGSAIRPTPPAPKTTMVLPGSGRATLRTAPAPVWTLQPNGASCARSRSSSTLTADLALSKA